MANPMRKPVLLDEPQPLLRPTAPAAPYPVEALGPLQRVVEAVQGLTQAPVALPAQSALAVASLAVQGFANVETLGGPSPLSLYALTIARSGERKSSCDSLLMEPLRDHEKAEAATFRQDLVTWQNKRAHWKGEQERILQEARKGHGEKRVEAEADLHGLGPEPIPPFSPERTVSEPTFEGLTRKFAEGHRSLGIFSDEGGQFLGGHAMSRDNRQKTLAALNGCWQGEPIHRTRAGEGSYTLHGRRLAVHLMVQPGVARAFLSDPQTSDTGFLARCLMTEPPSTIGTRYQANTRRDDEGLAVYRAHLRQILSTSLPMNEETRELSPRHLSLSPEARVHLATFADQVEARQGPGRDLEEVTGFASKSAEQAARIAGVLTLWEDLDAVQLGPATMTHAIQLAEYYLSEAKRLAHEATITAETERAENLRVWLQETWPEDYILPSDVVQRAPITSLREMASAQVALATLVKLGWLVPLEKGAIVREKPRKQAYRVVRPGRSR